MTEEIEIEQYVNDCNNEYYIDYVHYYGNNNNNNNTIVDRMKR